MGIDVEGLRIATVIGTIAAVFLYIYRIVCLIDMMRSTSQKLAEYNRVIYAGLIVFIPLGIGAWLYDFLVNEKKAPPLFVFSFSIVITTFVYGMSILLPYGNQFNFDYLTW